jgi:hypothetical protein
MFARRIFFGYTPNSCSSNVTDVMSAAGQMHRMLQTEIVLQSCNLNQQQILPWKVQARSTYSIRSIPKQRGGSATTSQTYSRGKPESLDLGFNLLIA